MKITTISIEGVGGIRNLTLSLNDRMNIICGPNGIGKTTILESIAHVFTNADSNIMKRNANVVTGRIIAKMETEGNTLTKDITFSNFAPEDPTPVSGFFEFTKKIISLKTTRTFQYEALLSLNRDKNVAESTIWGDAINGINITDIKGWFVNRFMYSKHDSALTLQQLQNFELAKKCFSVLDDSFAFSKVNVSTNEIFINTPSGEIYYEYLSSGFKSVLSILLGVIKEIELRFKEPMLNAADFDGIILIDEIELHFHPEWQEKIVEILLEVFPLVQFFVTTHSPHIIQMANSGHIIALEFIENNVIQRNLPSTVYGYQGWTIEEVLNDVMGMKNLRSKTFESILSMFQKAIDSEDYDNANKLFQEIDILLHPQNQLRKLLKFQLVSINR